jgi:hypothetical protein
MSDVFQEREWAKTQAKVHDLNNYAVHKEVFFVQKVGVISHEEALKRVITVQSSLVLFAVQEYSADGKINSH